MMANEEVQPSFEQQLAELEKIVAKLESGELSLEENVALFERGMKLSEGCKTQLESAESRIEVLLNPKENGPVRVEALAEDVGEFGDDEGVDEE